MHAPEIDDPLFRLEPSALREPHRSYDRIRAEAPVAWVPALGCFVVTSFDDIVEITRHPELFSSAQASGPRSVTPVARRVAEDESLPDDVRAIARRRVEISSSPILLVADPPLHERQRKLVNRAFTPRRVKEMEEPIRRIADQLIDDWHGAEQIEFNSQFAIGVPLSVIADALGIPRELTPTFRAWSDAFTVGVGNPNMSDDEIVEMLRQVNDFYDYFIDEIEARRAQPRDDFLSDMVEARIDGTEPLSRDEILQALSQFLVAGNETTAKLLGSAMLRLATDGALVQRMRDDRDAIPAFVEESLRLDAPAQGLFRTATEDCTVDGVDIPAGSMIFLSFAAGNRDGSHCPFPHDLDVDREEVPQHLSFGFGEHFCLGASLARGEARVAVGTLLDRLSSFELAVDEDELAWLPSFGLRGLAALPLNVQYQAV